MLNTSNPSDGEVTGEELLRSVLKVILGINKPLFVDTKSSSADWSGFMLKTPIWHIATLLSKNNKYVINTFECFIFQFSVLSTIYSCEVTVTPIRKHGVIACSPEKR